MNPADIQGLVVRGYGRLRHARYILLRFGDEPNAVRRWLGTLVGPVGDARPKAIGADDSPGFRVDDAVPKEIGEGNSPGIRVNIAFSIQGLMKLGLPEDALNTFPPEFAEGLGVPWTSGNEPDHRSRILGDVGSSCPEKWDWGYQGDGRVVHSLVLAFADDEIMLTQHVNVWIAKAEQCGAIAPGTTTVLQGRLNGSGTNAEPFGFADGISQPLLKGTSARAAGARESLQPRAHEVEDGEVLLGYRDNAGTLPLSPTVAAEADPFNLLPAAAAFNGVGRHDFGFNGTFLVFRQLSQDVAAFDQACESAAKSTGLTKDYVGALIVGRWKNGSPLINTPVVPNPHLTQPPPANDFTYAGDPDGKRCPIGAHIRRANPRDSLSFDAATSLEISNRHRILRRGRPYDMNGEVGLHFIGLNASIARQFEFVQQNWINDPTFGGLTGEDDPLVGARQAPGATARFTIPPSPESPVARQLADLKRFVTVRGGGYFFLPSVSALRYLSANPPALAVKARDSEWQDRPPVPTLSDKLRLLALARVPLLSAVVLFFLPFANLAPGPVSAMLGPTFDLDHLWEMWAVSTLTSLATVGSLLTFRMVLLYAWTRFKVPTAVKPITWPHVVLHQLISLPVVLWAWFRSSRDATTGGDFWWWSYVEFGAAAIAGYLVALLLIRFTAAVHRENARARNVAPVLLPAARIETRMERLASRLLGLLHRVSNLIEGLAATLSSEAAAGYIDRKGSLLPGHLTMLAFFFVLASLYVAGWLLLSPIGLQLPFGIGHVPAPGPYQVPPLGYLAFAVLAVGLAASSATFFLDKYRVPLLSLLLGTLVVVSITAGTDHQFEVKGDHLEAPALLADVVGKLDGDAPVVVVAAAGGGIRQTVWTTQVLTGLTTLWPEFPKRVTLVSAVSGGSLGALYYLNGYGSYYTYSDENVDPKPGDIHSVVHASSTSGSGDIWWGLAYPDTARALFSFFPTLFFPRTSDRGWALERAWALALGYSRTDEPTLNSWRQTTPRLLPAVAFNATVVETGERAVFTTYDPQLNPQARTRDARALTCGHDVSVATTVRLSAAFPYVTPTARAQERAFDKAEPNSTAARSELPDWCANRTAPHLADGGYWDNFGVVTAIEWLRAAQPALGNRKVLFLRIEPGPESTPPIHDRAWVWQATAPLATLLSVRTNAQRARNDEDVRALRERWNEGKSPGDPGTLSTARIVDTGKQPTLGWHLSHLERCEVEQIWREQYVGPSDGGVPEAMRTVERLLGPRSSSGGGRDEDCSR